MTYLMANSFLKGTSSNGKRKHSYKCNKYNTNMDLIEFEDVGLQ